MFISESTLNTNRKINMKSNILITTTIIVISCFVNVCMANDAMHCVSGQMMCSDKCNDRSCVNECERKAKKCLYKAFGRDEPEALKYDNNANNNDFSASNKSTGLKNRNPNNKHHSYSREIDRPHSNTGQACISVRSLETKETTSLEPHCVTRNEYGSCRDISYQFEAANNCSAPMSFQWRFPNSKYQSTKRQKIAPGRLIKVTCRKSMDRCDGNIEYTWTSSRY